MSGEQNNEDYQLPPVTLLNPGQQSDQSNEHYDCRTQYAYLEPAPLQVSGVDAKK